MLLTDKENRQILQRYVNIVENSNDLHSKKAEEESYFFYFISVIISFDFSKQVLFKVLLDHTM